MISLDADAFKWDFDASGCWRPAVVSLSDGHVLSWSGGSMAQEVMVHKGRCH